MMSLFDKEQILTAYIEEERQNAIREGREEGRKEGHEEGRREGHEEGHKEGHKEGQKQILQMLLSNGMDEDTLAASTGMSIAELKKLLEEN